MTGVGGTVVLVIMVSIVVGVIVIFWVGGAVVLAVIMWVEVGVIIMLGGGGAVLLIVTVVRVGVDGAVVMV